MSTTFYYFLCLFALSSSKRALKFHFTVHKDTTHTVQLGERTDIDCTTDDQDAKVTLWKLLSPRNVVQIVASSNVIAYNGYFFIKDTYSNDFGNYQCQAVDKLGNKITKKVNIQLDKSKGALVMNPDKDVLTVLADNSFKITCETSKAGSDTIKWAFKHVKQEPQNSDYTINEYPVGNGIKQSVLDVYRAKQKFTGSYECIRTTLFGVVISKRRIYVQVIALKIPSIKNPKRTTLTVRDGKPIDLDCVATGPPSPTLTWEKDGVPISTCTRIFTHYCANKPYLKTKKGLHIVSATFPNDNGSFTCKATNIVGTVKKTFDVLVIAPPKLHFPAHKVVAYNSKTYPLICSATKGNPPPQFKWTFKLKLGNYITKWLDIITPPKHHVTYAKNGMSSTVFIPGFIINAFYKCTATNKFGTSSEIVHFLRSKPNWG